MNGVELIGDCVIEFLHSHFKVYYCSSHSHLWNIYIPVKHCVLPRVVYLIIHRVNMLDFIPEYVNFFTRYVLFLWIIKVFLISLQKCNNSYELKQYVSYFYLISWIKAAKCLIRMIHWKPVSVLMKSNKRQFLYIYEKFNVSSYKLKKLISF